MIKTINPYSLSEKAYEPYTDAQLDAVFMDVSKKYEEYQTSSITTRLTALKKLSKDLRKNIDRYAQMMTEEMGKPLIQSQAEVEKCALLCDYYLENTEVWLADREIDTPEGRNIISYRPRGLVFIIMPWNFPFWQVFRAAVPALMAGNTLVLKHASAVTACSLELEKMFAQSFGADIFRSILVAGSKTDRLIERQKIAKINFTGSTDVGKIIASKAGSALVECVLELGGNDAYLVLPDADIEKAVAMLMNGRMQNNGQSCIAAKRWIIHEDVYNDFWAKAKSALHALKIGDPMEIETNIGPLVNLAAQEAADASINTLKNDGNNIEQHTAELPKRGYFFAPALVEVKDNNPAYNNEEIFAPVALIYKSKDLNEMIKLANDSSFGLGSGVFGGNQNTNLQIARDSIEAGGCAINGFYSSHPMLPFGGINQSGYGRELGELGLHSFCNIKTIQIRS